MLLSLFVTLQLGELSVISLLSKNCSLGVFCFALSIFMALVAIFSVLTGEVGHALLTSFLLSIRNSSLVCK